MRVRATRFFKSGGANLSEMLASKHAKKSMEMTGAHHACLAWSFTLVHFVV